ncbi:flagellar calcium-binding 24 kDa protein [Trypanosoma cruzi]|nr:flagellar calcium-binding 24 kDa protein [Trypanosoma cruzi]
MLVDEEEFKRAVPKLEAWGAKVEDPAGLFKELDKNGTGSVTFDEFAAWASAVKLGRRRRPGQRAGERVKLAAAE